MIVSGRGHAGHFLEPRVAPREGALTYLRCATIRLLYEFAGARFTYEIQDEAGGIAQALALAEDFADDDDIAVILGDNIFQDNMKDTIQSFTSGAYIFLKPVPDAARFGVAEVDKNRGRVRCIEEKPDVPKSDYAVTGLYIYNNDVFDVIKTLKPSGRGELEITDVNNDYIRRKAMGYSVLDGYWSNAGTFVSLLRAGVMVEKESAGFMGNPV